MKIRLPLFLTLCIATMQGFAQDTFSIVAVDSVTGEVGSAGASCVDLFRTSLSNDDFLGQLLPGIGAINTQAYYLASNQENAMAQMKNGQDPVEIIQWLVNNDVDSRSALRQYGVVAIVDGKGKAAAHTGSSTDDYKGHIIGEHYSIQGNILLDKHILDSMESRFLNEDGDLACKLMAALQGANVVGADSRCASNGTSSLFAFVKVAQASDSLGSPSFLESVRTRSGDKIEPIDSLQKKFDKTHSCFPLSIQIQMPESTHFKLYPNPSKGYIKIESDNLELVESEYIIQQMDGKLIQSGKFKKDEIIDATSISKGTYLLQISISGEVQTQKLIVY